MQYDLSPPEGWGISPELWAQTPPAMQTIVVAMNHQIGELQNRVAHLEARLNTNSKNSSKPPVRHRHLER
jgi:hypothetical protein